MAINNGSIEEGKRVIQVEIDTLKELKDSLSEEFQRAVDLLLKVRGRVIVSGVGKSGIVAKKIASTLTSLGTPAIFVHPTESLHGDLGIVSNEDVFIAISKSGESDEFHFLIPIIKRLDIPIISVTSKKESELARLSDLVLYIPIKREACPYDLAPTSSTTSMMALGDALSIALMKRKNFKLEDFAAFHPGGTIGKKIWLKVRDMMLTDEDKVPRVYMESPVGEVILEMTRKRGITSVIDEQGIIKGVITDGDLRRLLEKMGAALLSKTAGEIMTENPKTIDKNALAVDAAHKMEKYGITALIVVDEDKKVIGIIHLHDLMRARVV